MVREIGCIHNRSKTEVWMCGRCAFKHIEDLRLAEQEVARLSSAADPAPRVAGAPNDATAAYERGRRRRGGMRRWTLSEGAAFVASLSDWARREGYLLALYGSTLAGSGRDLDLIAVPWRPDTGPDYFLDAFITHVGGRALDRGAGLMCAASAAIDVAGRIVDLQVRRGLIESGGGEGGA